MAELNLSAFDGFLKDFYINVPQNQMRIGTVLLAHIKKDTKNINHSGRKAIVPIRLRLSQAIGGRADGGALPSAATGIKDQEEVTLKHLYGVMEVTGPTIRASRNDLGAFKRAVKDEMYDLSTSFKLDFNRQLHGTGTGRLALVASISGQVVTVDGDEGTQHIRAGQTLDIMTGATKHADSVVVSSVDSTTTFTVTGTISSVVDNDIAVLADSCTDVSSRTANYQIQGIAAGIDNDTGTYMGISRDTYSEWRAQINDGGSDTITLSDLRTMITTAEKQDTLKPATVANGHLLICDYDIRDKIVDIIEADKRHVNVMELAGGFTGIKYRNIALTADADCTPNKLWLLNLRDWALYSTSDIAWADEDGRVLSKVAGYDKYQATMYWDVELACSRPVAQVGLENVTT